MVIRDAGQGTRSISLLQAFLSSTSSVPGLFWVPTGDFRFLASLSFQFNHLDYVNSYFTIVECNLSSVALHQSFITPLQHVVHLNFKRAKIIVRTDG